MTRPAITLPSMTERPPDHSARAGATKRRRGRRVITLLASVLVLVVLLIYFGFVLPFWGIPFNASRHGRVPLTPPWALECWLWEDDQNTAAAVRELVEGYARHDIPVRTVLIDSPWSERYNDFRVDTNRYPEPENFFRDLEARGYRVVLWMTCMVNSRNKDTAVRDSQEFYEEARARGFLIGDGYQVRWWKGTGGFIDYTNPDAMAWWQSLQRQVLDWGVDGWKLDGADTFFSGRVLGVPVPFNRAHSGWLTTRQYMDLYARREYAHGRSRNPDFIVLVRALDVLRWAHPEGFAPLDAAPVTWVGDNQHTWRAEDRGLEAAIESILGSARLGYCVIGSDVAGYHGRSNPDDMGAATAALFQATRTGQRSTTSDLSGTPPVPGPDETIAPNIYIRWAQFSAFCGLFLNGGHGERRLWKRTPLELEIIRKFAWLHTELVPYIYSHVVACHRGGPPLMRPLRKGRFHYLFGDDFLVAPIHQDKSERTVTLPPGRWFYLFDDREVFDGPGQITRSFPLDEYPVFLREGAIVPLNVTRPYTGFGDTNTAGHVTWLIYPARESAFTLW
ncbi:MAG: glycoside hydrolase family 31 protein, partial [Verrucomicrobiales bacterium]|nr:glycoside hydrolase family 31 protein [Verrucomicrobiales bacterium]